MDTSTIRQQLHNYLEVADDKKVKAFYTMMEKEIKESAVEYTDVLKQELDEAYTQYKDGSATMISSSESKKRVQKLLKNGKSK